MGKTTTLKLRSSDYFRQVIEANCGSYGSFYDIEGITTLYHGDWADPEVEYNGIHANYYDLEDYLWDVYSSSCDGEGKPTSDDDFAIWVKDNADMVYEWFETYKEARYIGDFYGIEAIKMYDYSLLPAPSNESRKWENVRVECDGVSTEYNDLLELLYIYISNDPDSPVVIDDEEYAKYAKSHPDEMTGYFASLSEAS